MVLVLLQIGERDLKYPALQSIIGVLETSGSVNEGLSDALRLLVFIAQWKDGGEVLVLSDGECGGSLD